MPKVDVKTKFKQMKTAGVPEGRQTPIGVTITPDDLYDGATCSVLRTLDALKSKCGASAVAVQQRRSAQARRRWDALPGAKVLQRMDRRSRRAHGQQRA